MSVRVLRVHKRHAVRVPVHVVPTAAGHGDGKHPTRPHLAKPHSALLIELSAEGARVSQIDHAHFPQGRQVMLQMAGHPPLPAQVRWAHDGCIGLRLDRPLHNAELAALIALCRQDRTLPGALRAAG